MDTFLKVSVGFVGMWQPLSVVLLKHLDIDIALQASVGSVVCRFVVTSCYG